MLVFLFLFCTALLVHALLEALLPQPELIGDEWAYLSRARSMDPLVAGDRFLRVPAMGLLARLAGTTRTPLLVLRSAMIVLSAATAATTGFVAATHLGSAAGGVAGILMILLPERLLLGRRIWPDIPLSATAALLIVVIMSFGGSPREALLLGLTCAIAFLIRFDGLVFLPAALLALLLGPTPLTPGAAGLVVVPTLSALTLLAVTTWTRFRRFLPDDTLVFNLGLAVEDEDPDGHNCTISRACSRWDHLSTHEERLADLAGRWKVALRSPGLLLRNLLLRLIGLAGADSFSREIVLRREQGAHAGAVATILRGLLFVSFPFLLSWLVLLSLLTGEIPPYWLVPTICHLVVVTLFHFRTRFRLAALPGLVLWACQLTRVTYQQSGGGDTLVTTALASLLLASVLGWLSLVRREVAPTEPGAMELARPPA